MTLTDHIPSRMMKLIFWRDSHCSCLSWREYYCIHYVQGWIQSESYTMLFASNLKCCWRPNLPSEPLSPYSLSSASLSHAFLALVFFVTLTQLNSTAHAWSLTPGIPSLLPVIVGFIWHSICWISIPIKLIRMFVWSLNFGALSHYYIKYLLLLPKATLRFIYHQCFILYLTGSSRNRTFLIIC